MKLLKHIQEMKLDKGLPPVEKWNPPLCGDIGLKITRDGLWHYQNSPIGRKKLVRLFSTILRCDDDGYYLITPIEKVPIDVEDAPFLAIEMNVEGKGEAQNLYFRSNVDDVVKAGVSHPLRFAFHPQTQEPAPYIHIRARLEAKISRAIFYELVELAIHHKKDDISYLGLWSDGHFFPIAPSEGL